MIDIPEERILKEITDILMNDLPRVLLEHEGQSEDSILLPPFRYVGLEENLPSGTGLPYAFVEIEEGECKEKDRIVKKQLYEVNIVIHVGCNKHFKYYYYGFRLMYQLKNGQRNIKFTNNRISMVVDFY